MRLLVLMKSILFRHPVQPAAAAAAAATAAADAAIVKDSAIGM